MTIVVTNASPLIALSAVGKLELLKALFSEVVLPNAVHDEVVVAGAGRVGQAGISQALDGGWLQLRSATASGVLTTLKVDLDNGEAEAIVLALESPGALLLLDER